MSVVMVNHINIPAHQPHLKAKDRGIIAIVREDGADSITVGDPDKSGSEEHMAVFVDRPVASKALP